MCATVVWTFRFMMGVNSEGIWDEMGRHLVILGNERFKTNKGMWRYEIDDCFI